MNKLTVIYNMIKKPYPDGKDFVERMEETKTEGYPERSSDLLFWLKLNYFKLKTLYYKHSLGDDLKSIVERARPITNNKHLT